MAVLGQEPPSAARHTGAVADRVVIPERLARTVVQWEGDRGRAWLDDLPRLVEGARDAWDLQLDPPFVPGGQISWVAPARRSDGTEAVLKLQLPHPESAPEAAALRAFRGAGAVRLLGHDPDRSALLLERCRPGTDLLALGGPDEAVVAGARVGARLHEARIPNDVPTLGAVLGAWADQVEERLVRPFVDDGLARVAVDTMRRRPHECANPVLLHGDLNPTNVLAAARAPWLAIDPKPMVGEAAYDGQRLVTQPDPLATADPTATLARRLALVGSAMGVDVQALALWCLVGAVEMGTSDRAHGELASAQRMGDLAVLIGGQL